jgi:hypothetical protein
MRAIGRFLVLLILSVTLVACSGSSGKSRDTTAPVITLTGSNPQAIEAGTAYTELGATANDNRDGNLSGSIVIDASQVDTSVPDSYFVTYTVTDVAGNTGTATRTVTVEDTTPPVITLLGDDPQVIVAGNPYIEAGATATDTLDGDLTVQIVIDDSAINTMAAGDYTVTYDVTDAAGNAAMTVMRTVRVELPPPPATPTVSVEGDIKQLIFSWDDVADADYYRLMENPDGHSGFTQVGDDIPTGTLSATRDIAVHLYDWVNALYMVQACNLGGCADSAEVNVSDAMLETIGVIPKPGPGSSDGFGGAMAMSADGRTLVVGAGSEDSNATGINGDQDNDLAPYSGAAYVFRREEFDWVPVAYIKASNTGEHDLFGTAVALSSDGRTFAVGAIGEDGAATDIGGDQSDDSAEDAGAVYVFRIDGQTWAQQAYIKASNTDAGDQFGHSIALSADGTILVVGSPREDSASAGAGGNQHDNSKGDSGAVYVFGFDGIAWNQRAYLKASNPDTNAFFGSDVALDGDGDTMAVIARGLNRPATIGDGAAYVFRFDGSRWVEEALLPPRIWGPVALSADGNTLAASDAGPSGVFVFRHDNAGWNEQSYVTASNHDDGDRFGYALSLDRDGNTLVVGAPGEESDAVGINGDQGDKIIYPGRSEIGAAYVFLFEAGEWRQHAYVKATDSHPFQTFGASVALSADAKTLAVGGGGKVYVY